MKTVKIPLEIKDKIDEYRKGVPITKAIDELVSEFEETGDLGESRGNTNINLHDDTHDKLCRLKNYPTESLGAVIYRLIDNHNDTISLSLGSTILK